MIIAIEGISGSGKTTLINALIEKFGEHKKIVSIHHPNKESGEGDKAIDLIKQGDHLNGGLAALEDIKESFLLAKQNPDTIYLWSRCQLSTLVYNGRDYSTRNILLDKIDEDKCFPDYLYYIEANPKICHQRIIARNRNDGVKYSAKSLATDANYYRSNKPTFEKRISNYFSVDSAIAWGIINFAISGHG
jgi:thymidylate kinase